MEGFIEQINERIIELQANPTDVNIGKVAELTLVKMRVKQLLIQHVGGCTLISIIESDKTNNLANELKDYVNEHLYKWDVVKHGYDKTFKEWKEKYNR